VDILALKVKNEFWDEKRQETSVRNAGPTFRSSFDLQLSGSYLVLSPSSACVPSRYRISTVDSVALP